MDVAGGSEAAIQGDLHLGGEFTLYNHRRKKQEEK